MMRIALLAVVATLAACASEVKQSPTLRTHNYPDGRPHFEYQLKDFLPHGEGRTWYRNGELRSSGEYVNGVKHGMFTFYRDDGAFDYRAYFWKNVEVWRSQRFDDRPSDELIAGLRNFSGTEPHLGDRDNGGTTYEVVRSPGVEIDMSPPAPLFSTLDRTNSIDRVGLQLGFSDAGSMGLGAVKRVDLFANYRLSRFGVYGQYSQTTLAATESATLTGRRTLEGGGTFHLPWSVAGLALRAGVAVPVANDDPNGYLAASAGAYQRPTDAATSFPASLAMRTGASVMRSHDLFVVQGDVGADWIAGGANGFDVVARGNLGLGVGVRSAMLTAELTNSVRVTDPSRRIHGFALGTTIWVRKTWLALSALFASESHTTITGAIGYEL